MSSRPTPLSGPSVGVDTSLAPAAAQQSVRGRVVDEVVRGLYEGRFEPGQRLLEPQLTAALGISRGPVREAFNSLAAMGVVNLTLQRGAHIRVLTAKEAIDILIVAQGLTCIAARLAAQGAARSAARERIDTALAALEDFAASDATERFARARDNFYGALVAIADNAELRRVMPVLQIHLVRVQFRSILRRGDGRRLGDYRRIAAAVLAGDAGIAESATRRHFQWAIDALVEYRLADRDD